MIELARLHEMAVQLHVYDVDQGAWEHEPDGYEVNAGHVLLHLTRTIATKDFFDPEEVESSIAPDSIQYALRLGRWTEQANGVLLPTAEESDTARSASRRFNGRLPQHQVAVIEAAGCIADNLHEYDHDAHRDQAESGKLIAARQAARLLLYSADLQSRKYKFDPSGAFNARLSELRKRFSIPIPQTPTPAEVSH